MYRDNNFISTQELQRIAPTVFQEQPREDRSASYKFISTAAVIAALEEAGFRPVEVAVTRTRKEGAREYAKHMLRFRKVDAAPVAELGGLTPEVVLINSHDGASSAILYCGAYRLVCSNGLMIGFNVDESRTPHRGDVSDFVVAAERVSLDFPHMIDQAREWQGVVLNPRQQMALAEASLVARYGETPAPIRPDQILRTVRWDDSRNTLWNTFNRIQEHLVSGGVRGVGSTGRRLRTRAVTGLNENTNLNRALWTLAERLHEGVRENTNLNRALWTLAERLHEGVRTDRSDASEAIITLS